MNPQTTVPSSTSHNVDIEAQMPSNSHGETSRASSLDTAGSRRSTSSEHNRKKHSRAASVDESGNQDATEAPPDAPRVDRSSPHDTLPPTDKPAQQEWKATEPLITKIPKSETTMEDWAKAMEASDDGLCKGWRDQIDNLIIFAGLFSATVTAFTIESYQWLEETPADTLARLQLRMLLNATHDPAIDRLAPATFSVTAASVAINTLWFASLTLSLAAVVISILCKQWLYEYQRYDNFTTNEEFLIRGLRHRGLEAWRVPEIIASLPILLQTALVLFLIGILVLLWPLQTIVASVIAAIIGLTLLFLGVTTVLPSIQYVFPRFETQCAYKSSQSWSFFLITAFWMFDFREFTGWPSFDQWEVTRVYNGTGFALYRAYTLLCHNVDAVLSIYSFLSDTSLKPTINADLTLLSDFIDQFTSQHRITETLSNLIDLNNEHSHELRRLGQLKGWHDFYYSWGQRLKPREETFFWSILHANSAPYSIESAYHSGMHLILSRFLSINDHISHPPLFNRFVEHWARGTDGVQWDAGASDEREWTLINAYSLDIQYSPEIAVYLLLLHGQLLKTDQFSVRLVPRLVSTLYPRLMECYRRHEFYPPPVTLLKDIQEWFNRVSETDLLKRASYAESILYQLYDVPGFCDIHTSDLEKQHLESFARFFVTLYEKEDFLAASATQESVFTRLANEAIANLRIYLDQNDKATSGPTEPCST